MIRGALSGAARAIKFAGETTSDVPATITRSAAGRSFSSTSKNDCGSDAPNSTVVGLRSGR